MQSIILRLALLFMPLLGIVSAGHSQEDESDGMELSELIRIATAYRAKPFISFSVDYIYSDSANWPTHLEELKGQYKISNGRFWSMLDSTEVVQGGTYNLAIYHDMKLIVVSNPAVVEDFTLQVPILDSMFEQSFVDSMHTNILSDTTKQLCIIFKEGSPYTLYEIFYNPQTYMIQEVKLHQTNIVEEGEGYGIIRVFFQSYSEELIPDSVFNEAKYVSKSGGTLIPTALYSDYEIIVNGNF